MRLGVKTIVGKSKTLPIILLLLLAFISTFFMIHSRHWRTPSINSQQIPDALLFNAQVYQYNKTGKLHSYLESPHVTHFALQNSAIYITPRITIYSAPQTIWLITSDKGDSVNGSQQINLNGNVVIYQPANNKTPSTQINTDHLTIFPERSWAQTDAAISISQPNSTITAVGMTADLKNNIVHLKSQSKGDYSDIIATPPNDSSSHDNKTPAK